jgi:CRP-like cAMP-binding protein
MLEQANLQNRILSRLSAADFAHLAVSLERISCKRGTHLIAADQTVEHVFFAETGVSSVIARTPEGQAIESGMIGREGYVHPTLVLGSDRMPYDVLVQVDGDLLRIPRQDLLAAAERSGTLRNALLKFAAAQAFQVSYTALSNSVHQVDERLARWLLMCHDRSPSDDLPLTHEFMSLMLAVRRPSVTNALHVLEGNGFIEAARGFILIRNRAAMEEFAGDAYGKPEAEYRRLLGPL